MKTTNESLISILKQLLTCKEVECEIPLEIIDIREVEYKEFCLTLKSKDSKVFEGIFIKTDKVIKKRQIIIYCELSLINIDSISKIYIKDETLCYKNPKSKTEDIISNSILYNLQPENLVDFFSSFYEQMKEYQENIFIVKKIDKHIIKLFCIYSSNIYNLDLLFINHIHNLREKDFIYCKNYLVSKNQIICDNLTIIKKPSDFELFHLTEVKLTNNKEIYEFPIIDEIKRQKSRKYKNESEIKDKVEEEVKYLIVKVVLKDIENNIILLIDSFNRLIKIEYKSFEKLNLFDLILLVNYKLKESKDNDYTYDLILSKDSIFYSTNKLFFDKRILLNNFTILDIYFPDFQSLNFYDNLIIGDFYDYQYKIVKNRVIYVIQFENEKYNEVVPYKIAIKNQNKNISYSFFIVHNLIFKINIFINNKNDNNCCIDYCYYNIVNKIPKNIEVKINEKKYMIDHSNSFDNKNRNGFILINIPQNKYTNYIKKKTILQNISAQVWFCPLTDKSTEMNTYFVNEIFNVEEAQKRLYFIYNLSEKNYSIFDNFYAFCKNLLNDWKESKKEIIQHFNILSQNKDIISEINKLIFYEDNINYVPDSLNYNDFQTYINISLFASFDKIRLNSSEDKFFDKWENFFEIFNNLVEKLQNLGKKLIYHQKVRILNQLLCYYFKRENQFQNIKFFYMDEKKINKDNSYFIALNFNKNVISKLTEESALTQGFLQLDGYILKNYFIEEPNETYSLNNEPLVLMKNHLLSNYENFLFIIYENPIGNLDIKACENKKNKITLINEKSLFNSCNSEKLTGKNNALPITMEFFHEKYSHSKKCLKKLLINSPLLCIKNNKIDILSESEDGKFIESLFGDNLFILNLKNPKNELGKLLNEEYFTDKNFDKLHLKSEELMKNKNLNYSQKSDMNISNQNNNDLVIINKKIIEEKYEIKKQMNLEDYENLYLVNGNFIYPDSLPFHEHYYGENPEEISIGEKDYLKKYESQIIEGKKIHLGED